MVSEDRSLLVESAFDDIKGKKQNIAANLDPSTKILDWDGRRHIELGIVADPHLNSKYTQITYLHNIYDIFESRGIEDVFNAGDMDEGEQMRVGHQYECYNQGADEHKDEIVCVYPRRERIKTRFITGNHDASLIKRSGFNIGKAIARERSDMEYLGPDCAVVMITPNCSLELRHPWDGTAYAVSYKPQKIVESLSERDKPTIMVIGHYHKALYMVYRDVHCIMAGTLCAQTPFMKGKAIQAHMGGWVIGIDVDETGTLTSFKPEFIPYIDPIKEDWKNWRHLTYSL